MLKYCIGGLILLGIVEVFIDLNKWLPILDPCQKSHRMAQCLKAEKFRLSSQFRTKPVPQDRPYENNNPYDPFNDKKEEPKQN